MVTWIPSLYPLYVSISYPLAVESANFPPFFSKENQLEKLEKNGKTPMSRASILSSPTSAVHPSLESFRCFPATFNS
jgi:hypothetical protein